MNGFDGFDGVFNANDCHVSIAFRDVCYIVTLVLSILALIVSTIGMLKLWLKWGVLFWQNVEDGPADTGNSYLEKEGNTRTRDDPDQQPSPKTPRRSQYSKPTTPKETSFRLQGQAAHLSLSSHTNTTSAHTSGTRSSIPRPQVQNPSVPLESLPPTLLHPEDRESTDRDADSDATARQENGSRLKKRASRTPRLSIKPMKNPKTNIRNWNFIQDVAEAKRRRNICILMSLFVAFSIYSVILFCMFLANVSFLEQNALQLWSFWSSMTCFHLSIWAVTYSFCASLPTMKGYQKMFPSFGTSILIQHPSLSNMIVSMSVIIISINCVVMFFILPLLFDTAQFVSWILPTGFTVLAGVILVMLLFQVAVFSLLLKMFNAFVASQKSDVASIRSDSHAKSFEKAKNTVKIVFIASLIFGPCYIALLLATAWSSVSKHHLYFLLSFMYSASSLIVIGATYIFLYRISTGNTEKRRKTQLEFTTNHHNNGQSVQEKLSKTEDLPRFRQIVNDSPHQIVAKTYYPSKESSEIQLG